MSSLFMQVSGIGYRNWQNIQEDVFETVDEENL